MALNNLKPQLGRTGPARNGATVTPSNATIFSQPTRGFYVGVSGDVKVRFFDNQETVILVGVAAGVIHPMSVDIIYATDTTATDIVRVW